LASPHWSAGRERLLEAKLERALAGESDDPDEDDPVESFRSQYLNIWPARRVAVAADDVLVAREVWAAAADLTVPIPAGGLVVAVEDWFGHGAAAAAAGVLDDGRVLVFGGLFAGRVAACGWAEWLVGSHPGSRVLVGASLAGDPAVLQIGVVAESFGTTQTASALTAVRELLGSGRLVHDGASELAEQVGAIRVRPGAGGLLVSPRSGRSDLARCAAWAATEAVKATAPPVGFFVW
jgi:hypothetical protein